MINGWQTPAQSNVRERDPLFSWIEGVQHYRGLKVEQKTVLVADRTFRVVALKDAADLLDDEHFAKQFIEEDRAPYGMELWPAASMLAQHLVQGEGGAGRTALELGCGLGLVSIVGQTHGWRMVATDNEPESLRFVAYNAALNEITLDSCALLDWNAPAMGQRFDRVFGADLLYDRANAMPILKCLRKFLVDDGAAILTDPNRSVADNFVSLARDQSFQVRVQTTSVSCPQRGTVNGRIFELHL